MSQSEKRSCAAISENFQAAGLIRLRWADGWPLGAVRGNLPSRVEVTVPPAIAPGSDVPPAVLALAAIARRWPQDFATAILPNLGDTLVKELYARTLTE